MTTKNLIARLDRLVESWMGDDVDATIECKSEVEAIVRAELSGPTPSATSPDPAIAVVQQRLREIAADTRPGGPFDTLLFAADLLASIPQQTPSAEPGVQVPAELIEHVRAAHEALTNADRGTWVRELQTTIHDLSRTKVFEAQRELSAAVALLSQPTAVHFAPYGSNAASDGTPLPRSTRWNATTGEYQDGEPFTVKRDRTTCPDCRARFAAEPVSIADMALGTTFVWNTERWDVARRWTVREEGGARYLVDGDGRQWPASMFDPSRIRDVTPPTATPEGEH